jgi:molybdopterin converting factor subunit 1
MTVRVRLFAILRERAGRDEVELELPEGARVADALAAVDHLAGGLSLVMAVNREYARPDQRLAPGDELALIPPVSGGGAPHVRISAEPLSADAVAALVRDPRAGAVVTFQGVTREVDHLDYEAYEAMALEAMRAILEAAVVRHGLCGGTVPLGEPSVVVAVSAPHRGEAFAAAREVIDELKAGAPIWKREVEAGGEARWVGGAPPRAHG